MCLKLFRQGDVPNMGPRIGRRGGECIDALKLLADVPVSKEAVVPDTRVPQPVQNRGSTISVHQTNCFTSPQ